MSWRILGSTAVVVSSALSATALAAPSGRRCGTEQIAAAPLTPSVWHAPGPQRIIYLNRFGGTYQVMGRTSNAETNVVSTSVTANRAPRTAVIPPLAAGFNWDSIAACVAVAYAPYDVRIVEFEPPPGTVYVEAVVGGFGTELGFGVDDLFGIAAADNFCGVTERGVAFSFSETHRNVAQRDGELCATIAHEVGHLLALEHEVLATDMMSYVLVAQTTSKSFVDQASACGVRPGQEQGCSCGGADTNSAMRLGSALGPRATESNLPTIQVLSPASDGRLAPLFTVEASATDGEGMADVLVYLDGVVVGVDGNPDGDRYDVTVNGATIGGHTLGVVARDLAGNTSRVDLPITVALRDDGEDCESGAQCAGGQCAAGGDGNFCTQVCDPGASVCGDGFECIAAGDLNLCAPEAGGCCSTGGRSASDLAGMLVLMLVVGLVGMRRRRQ